VLRADEHIDKLNGEVQANGPTRVFVLETFFTKEQKLQNMRRQIRSAAAALRGVKRSIAEAEAAKLVFDARTDAAAGAHHAHAHAHTHAAGNKKALTRSKVNQRRADRAGPETLLVQVVRAKGAFLQGGEKPTPFCSVWLEGAELLDNTGSAKATSFKVR
jgi:hypothetical protein